MKNLFFVLLIAITFGSCATTHYAPYGARPGRVIRAVNDAYVTAKHIEYVIDDTEKTIRLMEERFPVKVDDKANVKYKRGPGNQLTGRIHWMNAKINARGSKATLTYYNSAGQPTSQHVITLDDKGVHEFYVKTKAGQEKIRIIVVDQIMNLRYSDGQTEALLGHR